MKLTLREREVITLLASGLSAKRIGAKMGVSTRTIEHWLLVARRKMGAENGTDLVCKAIYAGEIGQTHAS